MVALFKRKAKKKDPETKIFYQLENIVLEDKEDYIYAKRVKTNLKKETLFTNKSPYVMIEQIQVIEGGIFSSKTVSFTITVCSEGLKVVRLKSDFKWLVQMLSMEFPFVPLPPLIQLTDKTYEPPTLKLMKVYYEKFLNELIKHKMLRSSLALEIFLTEVT